ncbi:uncharacterized protein LOC108676708 [Hyalella azteca]|uniref:Uncharacterized protein LOC108676708 n=1 Tax=Hyalella azteca TaxID=294128 RepID=A0A8B7P5G1_HYAAZ|nr:uncharacterized protein LOC108676708 [Hyalella azteca]
MHSLDTTSDGMEDNSNERSNLASSPSAEVLKSVEDSLKKLLTARGNEELSGILVHKFSSNSFFLPASKLPHPGAEEVSLQYFLRKVSAAGKSKNSNKLHKQKAHDRTGVSGDLVAGAKTLVDLKKVKIGNLECSETWEIVSIDKNLPEIKLKLELISPVENQNYGVSIQDPIEAQKILEGLDIHLLLNIIQNGMLQLNLSPAEAQVVQALRICRNQLSHSVKVPQPDWLNDVAAVLKEALLCLAQPTQQELIEQEITCILKRLSSETLIGELQAELRRRAPRKAFIERRFLLPSGRECTTSELHGMLMGGLRVRGEVCSGRTSFLLQLYAAWAEPSSSLAAKFRLCLPPLNQLPADDKYPVMAVVRQWAPCTVQDYGEAEVEAVVLAMLGETLVLVDAVSGYDRWPCAASSGWVVTDGILNADLNVRAVADVLHKEELSVTLLPLTEEQVREEVRGWNSRHSTQYSLLQQFQDKELLTCPHALSIFQRITSTVVRNLDLQVMRELVETSHQRLTRDKDDSLDGEFYYEAAFNNILANKQIIEHINGRQVPAYVVGPRNGSFYFKSLGVEEYCAAMYVVNNPHVASWRWLRHSLRFQRVFTFVLQYWNERGLLQKHQNIIENYLSVVLGLYRYKNVRNDYSNAKHWRTQRPLDWTLEQEGFVRVNYSKCKLWLHIFYVLESASGDLMAVQLVLRHLLQYTCWILDVKSFSDAAYEEFSRLCHKIVALFSKQGSVETLERLPLMKLNYRCNLDTLKGLDLLLQALCCLLQLNKPCQVMITEYYNRRDYKYGRAPLVNCLKDVARRLHESRLSVTSFVGPLALPPVSLQEGGFSSLKELRVTVYSCNSVQTLLQSCPQTLRWLNLSVDLIKTPHGDSAQSSYKPPQDNIVQDPSKPSHSNALQAHGHVADQPCAVPPSCYVRLALRYPGALQVMSLFSGVRELRVLRLHGIHPPDAGVAAPSVPSSLHVRCLVLKFVSDYGVKHQPQVVRSWCSSLLSSLTSSCGSFSRLIVARPPAPWSLTEIQSQLRQEALQVQRLIVQGGTVSAEEALTCLRAAGAQPLSPAAHEGAPLRARLPQERLDALRKHKPSGHELLIINVTEGADVREFSEGNPEGLPPHFASLVQAAYESALVSFCYEAQEGALEVLLAPTRDLRLHLTCLDMRDQHVEQLHQVQRTQQVQQVKAVLQLLSRAQYVMLRCPHLTARGFIALITALDAVRGGGAQPYSITLITTLQVQAPPALQEQVQSPPTLQEQAQLLKKHLLKLPLLNYACFCVLDEQGAPRLTVRRTHGGDLKIN